MTDFKISSFIIALIVVSLILTGFGLFMGDMNTKYARSDYNDTELSSLSKMSEMSSLAQDMRNKTNVDKDASLFDVIGAYFTSGFSAAKVAVGSVDTFITLGDDIAKKTPIPYINTVWAAIVLILLIIIFIGILLSLLIKDRI